MSSIIISRSKAWTIWGIAALFYLYELTLRVAPSVMTNDLMITFNATSTMLGILISSYYYSYTILQLPCGIILDKLGPKKLLIFSSFLCVIGSFLFAGFDKVYIAQIGRFLVGAGSACAFISCLQIATSLFPKKYFVILAGATNMMGTLGGLLGGFPVAKSVNSLGWKNTIYILAFIGILIIIAMLVFIPKNIQTVKNEKNSNNNISIIKNVTKLLKNNQIIFSGVIASLMYLPISAFAEIWVVPFCMSKYNIGNELASLSSAFVFIGVSLGSIILAFLAKRINSYMKTIKIAILGTALAFTFIIFCKLSMITFFIIVFIVGLLTGAQPINFTCAKNNASIEISGTVLALTNCIVMLIGSIFQPFFGYLLDIFWTGKISENGVRIYEEISYRNAMLLLPICLIIAYIFSIFVKETITTEDD